MSNDSDLQQVVLSELRWDPSVDAEHIGVTAKAGVVTLTGHVESFAEKRAAEAAAGRVRGVRAIAEEIEVRLPFDNRRDDEDLAAAALERLAWDVSLPRNAIKVKVEKGLLTLTGEVTWEYQRHAAEQDVQRLLGVIRVSNQISIKPRVNVGNLSDDIMHALHRSWFFDPQTIKVTARGGKVHLTGTAASVHDRQLAAATAWAAPGVTDVQNDVIVEVE
jgi:osmotically-inducible protein OsmY